MRSKVFKIFGLVMIAQICLYACCTEINHLFVNTLDFTVRDVADSDITSVSNADFSLLAKVAYDREVVSSIIKQSNLINTANATTCAEEYIITKRITNIELFANVSLFGIEAENPLNNHVRVGYGFIDDTGGFTVNDMIAALNFDQTNHTDEYYLTFDTQIPSNTTVRFKLVFTFENGDQLERLSTEITFE